MTDTNTLSDRDIIQILQNQNIHIHGIYMKDELPNKLTKGFYIVNLQSSTDGNGTHWVALYYNPVCSYYFDVLLWKFKIKLYHMLIMINKYRI